MARAMLMHERGDAGEWKPTGVFLATSKRLQARMLPGSASRDAFMKYVLSGASRPTAPFSTTKLGWPDWIEWATWSLSDGYIRMMVEVTPMVTLDQLYAREVLGENAPASHADPKLQPMLEQPPVVRSWTRELKGGLAGISTKTAKGSSLRKKSKPPFPPTSDSTPSPETGTPFLDRLLAESRAAAQQPSRVTILVPPKKATREQ